MLRWSQWHQTLEKVWAASSSYALKSVDYKLLNKLRERNNRALRSDFLWAFSLLNMCIQTLICMCWYRLPTSLVTQGANPAEDHCKTLCRTRNESLILSKKCHQALCSCRSLHQWWSPRTHKWCKEIPAAAAILYIGKRLLETDENFSSRFILI